MTSSTADPAPILWRRCRQRHLHRRQSRDIVSESGNVGLTKLYNSDMGGIDEVRTTLSSYALPIPMSRASLTRSIETLPIPERATSPAPATRLTMSSGAGRQRHDRWRSGDRHRRLQGNESDYKITWASDGTVTVSDLRRGSPDGTDTLKTSRCSNLPMAPRAWRSEDLFSTGYEYFRRRR